MVGYDRRHEKLVDMTTTPTWDQMNLLPRVPAVDLPTADIPDQPGVFVWYHRGVPVQVGKATAAGGLRRQLTESTNSDIGEHSSPVTRALRSVGEAITSGLDAIRATVTGGNQTQAEKTEAYRAEAAVAWAVLPDTVAAKAAWKTLTMQWHPAPPRK